jgi:NAD(P)-dependent dehydrogenase (short-subunit alcohol dehydrogenase family)
MPGTSPIILILGAGPNIGKAVTQIFASNGYKIALAARSLKETDSTDNQLNIATDLANTDDVVKAFEKVNKVFGIPSVVVYNGRSLLLKISLSSYWIFAVSASTLTPPDDPFSLPLAAFNRDVTVNVTSAFVAAQQAAAGFARLPTSASRTFIYTGNILNIAIIPGFLDQGVGKCAGAYMIWAASAAYKDRGFK